MRNDGRTDYESVVRCICQRPADDRLRQDRFRELCSLPPNSVDKTFDTYQTFGEKFLSGLKNLAMDFAHGASKYKWLTLTGDTDLGKSHLAIAICREWLKQGKAARYVNVPNVLLELREGIDKNGSGSYNTMINFFCKVGLLVLDDLGTENVTMWGCEQLQMILNYRYENELHTVITTNRPLDDLFYASAYKGDNWRHDAGMRIASRLQRESWTAVVVVEGQPHMMRS